MAQLKEVLIHNFRNVESSHLVFNGNNIIVAGKNMIGKTNTLNAIHWAFTGVTMDGSADNRVNFRESENKTAEEFSVTLTFDTFDFTRVCKMEDGKPTVTIYIGTEKAASIKKGEATIHYNLGLTDMILKEGKIDIVRFLLNPLYFDTVPAKDLRKFFYSLSNISFSSMMEDEPKMVLKVIEKYNKTDPYELADKIGSEKKAVKADIATCKAAAKLFPNIKADAEKLQAKKEKELKTIEGHESLCERYALDMSRVINEYYSLAMGIQVCLLEKGAGDDVFKDVCYPLLPKDGRPFALGSYAERSLVGMMFINEVCKKWKINPLPILLDNMESLDDTTTHYVESLGVQYIGALVK